MNDLSHPIPSSEPVTLIQLSDLHLNANAEDTYNDIYPDKHLQRCLTWLQNQTYDYLLLTGDLANHGHPTAYQRLYGYLNNLGKPWQWLPGNHDNKQMMLAIAPQAVDSLRLLSIGCWNVILLDSTCLPNGQGAGSISQEKMHELEQYLQASQHNALDKPPKPVLIALHHNPIPIHPQQPDPIMLGNHAAFCELVAKFDQVKAITFGHVHQVIDRRLGSQRFFSAPATSVQFVNHTNETIKDPRPGVRIIKLVPDGHLDTQVLWIEE